MSGSHAAVQAVLSPRSVAVVGATDRLQYGGRLLANLLAAPPPGGVWPVNPNRAEVMGHTCYPSLVAVPAPVDLACVIVPAERVIPVLADCAAKGVTSAVIISAGFAERADAAGRTLQAGLLAAIRRTGVRVVGPNCFGVDNLVEGIHPNSHFTALERANAGYGGLALLSHSGASAYGPVAAACRLRGIDLEYIVSSGNELDLDTADFIDYWVADDRVRAIALLLEGIRDGQRFLAAARRAALAGKPLVVCKVGRSPVGARAAATHTAAMTGAWAVHRAAFQAAGVTLADDYDDLVELAYMLGHSRLPAGGRCAVLSHSGGIGALVGDRLGELDLEVPPLSAAGAARLAQVLAGRGWPGNPADVTGHFKQPSFREIVDVLLAEPQVDLLVAATYGEEAAGHLAEAYRSSGKPVLACYTEGPAPGEPGLERLRGAGVPAFYQPGKAARAVRALVDFAAARAGLADAAAGPAPAPTPAVQAALAAGQPLAEADALALVQAAGVPGPRHARCAVQAEAVAAAAGIGYPVVVKVDSPDILHKTEAGGVRLNIRTPAELAAACQAVLAGARAHAPQARIHGVVVAEQVAGGIEVIVGIHRDATFGPVLLLGLGGVQAEALQAVAHRLCPLTPAAAEALIDEVPGLGRLLAGFRGRPAGDRAALAGALVALSRLAAAHAGQLAGLDVNPLVVRPPGQGVVALDAAVVPG